MTSPRQDPTIKGDPYAATWDAEAVCWRVRSASAPTGSYAVDLERRACSCRATVPCWHLEAAAAMEGLVRQAANCRRMYRGFTLAELQAEDARLRALLAAFDDRLVRAQLGVVGDHILDRLALDDAAA